MVVGSVAGGGEEVKVALGGVEEMMFSGSLWRTMSSPFVLKRRGFGFSSFSGSSSMIMSFIMDLASFPAWRRRSSILGRRKKVLA